MKIPVRICRKIGSASKNTVVQRHAQFLVVPRTGDLIRLNVYGKTIEVESVVFDPEGGIDIFIKPDYRGYGKDKVKSHDEIVAEYDEKGWFA